MDILHKAKSALVKIFLKIKITSKKQYTASQYAYFTAVSCLIVDFTFFNESSVWVFVASVLAFLGMLRELLSLFRKLWDTILGKSIIVITYASLTNLAFAFAALKINDVTGVEPFPFTYTLGFTTFILMPFWLTLSSIILLSLAIMIANIWMFLRLCLKVIGVRLKMHWEDENLAVLTMLFRIALIPLVMVSALQASSPYFPSMGVDNKSKVEFGGDLFKLQPEITAEIAEELAKNQVTENTTLEGEVMIEKIDDKSLQIERLVAKFIWSLESYSHSFCQKNDEQKSVIIDDFSVLLISKDEEEPLGYKFEIKECIPVYKQVSGNTVESEVVG